MSKSQLQQDLEQVGVDPLNRNLTRDVAEAFNAIHNIPVINLDEPVQQYRIVLMGWDGDDDVPLPTLYDSYDEAKTVMDGDAFIVNAFVEPVEPVEPKFILLEGIEHNNRFYCTYDPSRDQRKSFAGEVWYRILGYASTDREAQDKLYGGWPR